MGNAWSSFAGAWGTIRNFLRRGFSVGGKDITDVGTITVDNINSDTGTIRLGETENDIASFSGNVGIGGITDPDTILQILNDNWFSAKNYAGDAAINILKINVDDELDVGGTLVSGSLEFTEDSGVVSAMDMPVSATPAAGVEQSYTFKIDGNNVMTIYAEADSSGGIQNPSVRLNTPTIYSQAPQVLTGAGAVDITSAITHIVSNGANALTLADGTEGQVKFIVMKTDGGDATLTPTNLANGSTLTFDAVGESVQLLFTNGAWHWMGGKATLA